MLSWFTHEQTKHQIGTALSNYRIPVVAIIDDAIDHGKTGSLPGIIVKHYHVIPPCEGDGSPDYRGTRC